MNSFQAGFYLFVFFLCLSIILGIASSQTTEEKTKKDLVVSSIAFTIVGGTCLVGVPAIYSSPAD
jgi:hypothetical protein